MSNLLWLKVPFCEHMTLLQGSASLCGCQGHGCRGGGQAQAGAGSAGNWNAVFYSACYLPGSVPEQRTIFLTERVPLRVSKTVHSYAAAPPVLTWKPPSSATLDGAEIRTTQSGSLFSSCSQVVGSRARTVPQEGRRR